MMLIYYKTWIYQCLIKQVKSSSICSRAPNSVRIRQTGRTENRGVTLMSLPLRESTYKQMGVLAMLMWPPEV